MIYTSVGLSKREDSLLACSGVLTPVEGATPLLLRAFDDLTLPALYILFIWCGIEEIDLEYLASDWVGAQCGLEAIAEDALEVIQKGMLLKGPRGNSST